MPLDLGDENIPYQNVIFTGSGIKKISARNIKVLGNLTIHNGSKLDNTVNKKDIILLGKWIDENTATAGFIPEGNVRFEGTSAQTIVMANNSMKETFYNFTINNASGVTIGTGDVEVSNQLFLTLGNINFASTASNTLTITNIAENAIVGGSVNSFVNGPLSKIISNSSSFQFPVGDAISSGRNRIGYVSVTNTSTSGSQIWTAQFFDKNPTSSGYNITEFTEPLISVIGNEYWNVTGPTTGSANVVLTWDQYTGMHSDLLKRSYSAVAEWNAPTTSKWISVGTSVTDNGQTSGTVATTTPVNLGNHIFTIGARATTFTATSSGDWSIVDTWGTTVLPGVNDAVVIGAGTTVTLNTTGVVIAQLTVSGTFNNGANTLEVSGNLTLNGTWASSTGGKINMAGTSGSILGSCVADGTCTLEIAGNRIIDGNANLTLPNVSILTGVTLENYGTVTINSLTSGGTFENKNGSTLYFTGANMDAITLTANECSNTVVFGGTIEQSVKHTTTYCNLILTSTGLKLLAGTATVNGDVTIDVGTTFKINSSGNLTFPNSNSVIANDGVFITE
jgi:hypothetical protein